MLGKGETTEEISAQHLKDLLSYENETFFKAKLTFLMKHKFICWIVLDRINAVVQVEGLFFMSKTSYLHNYMSIV